MEDEPSLREMMMRILERHGHRITPVAHGRAAIRELRTQRFDVILTDILMPEADGLEVINEVKERQPEARVIAMSGGSFAMSATLCLRLADPLSRGQVLEKPFTSQELLAAVENAGPAAIAS